MARRQCKSCPCSHIGDTKSASVSSSQSQPVGLPLQLHPVWRQPQPQPHSLKSPKRDANAAAVLQPLAGLQPFNYAEKYCATSAPPPGIGVEIGEPSVLDMPSPGSTLGSFSSSKPPAFSDSDIA